MEDAVLTHLDCIGGSEGKISLETKQAIGELAEMLAAMERVSGEGASAFTTRQIMQAMKISEKRCIELLRRGIAAGAVRPCRKTIIDLAGRPQAVPAYEQVK